LLAAIATGVGVAAIIGVSQSGVGSADVNGVKIPAAVLPKLAKLAHQWSLREGDRSPSSVLAVRTTRFDALRLADPADRIPRSRGQAVYLVVETGRFTPRGIAAPPGWAPSSQPNLVLILDAKTLAILDYGVGGRGVHAPRVTLKMLQGLGPVSRLVSHARN